MFSEILAECIYYMNEEEKKEFYKLCMENKHIKKRIDETEKCMTCYEKQKLIEKWEKNKKNDK